MTNSDFWMISDVIYYVFQKISISGWLAVTMQSKMNERINVTLYTYTDIMIVILLPEKKIIICFFVASQCNISFFFEGSWEALSQLTSCWLTQNIHLARWALRVTTMSCFTWLMTWLSAYCRPSRTPAQAFLTPGWVTLLWPHVRGTFYKVPVNKHTNYSTELPAVVFMWAKPNDFLQTIL